MRSWRFAANTAMLVSWLRKIPSCQTMTHTHTHPAPGSGAVGKPGFGSVISVCLFVLDLEYEVFETCHFGKMTLLSNEDTAGNVGMYLIVGRCWKSEFVDSILLSGC